MRVKTLRALILLLNLVLFAGTAAAAGLCVVTLARSGERKARGPSKGDDGPPPKPVRIMDARPLGSYAALWTLQAEPGAVVQPVEDVEQETERDEAMRRLQGMVHIWGVIPNTTAPSKGWAILSSDRNGRDSTVIAGGDLFLGAKVMRIQRDGIFFSYMGHDDLFVPYADAASSPAAAPPNARAVRNPPPGARAAGVRPGQPVPQNPTAVKPGDPAIYDTFSGTKKLSENHWQLDPREKAYIVKNQARIRSEARLTPHYNPKTGKADGVEIRGADKGTLVHKRGFRKSDVIKAVNGVPVTGPQSIESLTKKFRNSRKVTITFERRGVTKTVTYNVR